MKKLCMAIAATYLISGCTSTNYTESANEIRLHSGLGGFLLPILARYSAWEESGKRIVIDGHMVSADAFGAFSSKNACYTERAIFSPHAASTLGIIPDYEVTNELAAMLPEALEAWFRSDFSYRDWVGVAMVDYPDLLRLWPEGACTDDHSAALDRYRQLRSAAEVAGGLDERR